VDGDSRLVPRRNRLHGGDVQERRQDDISQGVALKDPAGLFNSSLDGNAKRAIDIHEGDKVNEAALKDLIHAASGTQSQGQEQAEAPASEQHVGRLASSQVPATIVAILADHFR